MTAVLSIFLLSCGGLLLLVFCKPAVSVRGRRVSIFWTAPLAGALCMILTGQISPGEVAEGLTGAGEVNPLKILVLFFSMTMMSVYLDELGFFRLLAVRILRRAGGSVELHHRHAQDLAHDHARHVLDLPALRLREVRQLRRGAAYLAQADALAAL